jgi:hypothetical protein
VEEIMDLVRDGLIDRIINMRRELEGIEETDTEFEEQEKVRLGRKSSAWLLEELDFLYEMLSK